MIAVDVTKCEVPVRDHWQPESEPLDGKFHFYVGPDDDHVHVDDLSTQLLFSIKADGSASYEGRSGVHTDQYDHLKKRAADVVKNKPRPKPPEPGQLALEEVL